MPSSDIVVNNIVAATVDEKAWKEKAWLIKLSRFGSIPIQRVPVLLCASLADPLVVLVDIPNHPEYLLGLITNKEACSYFRNTYYCYISVISTEVKDSAGNCTILLDYLPNDSHLILLKKESHYMGLPVVNTAKFQPADLNKLGLLIVTTPKPLEQSNKFLVN